MQRKADLCEIKDSLVCLANSRLTGATKNKKHKIKNIYWRGSEETLLHKKKR